MPLRDFVYAARTLRKSPVFAVTSVMTIALAVGASTAIFCVTNAVLLRPLPYKDPGRLVYACADLKTRNLRDYFISTAYFFDLRNARGLRTRRRCGHHHRPSGAPARRRNARANQLCRGYPEYLSASWRTHRLRPRFHRCGWRATAACLRCAGRTAATSGNRHFES